MEASFFRFGCIDRAYARYAPSLGVLHLPTYRIQRGKLISAGGPNGVDESVVAEQRRAAKAGAATQIAPRVGDAPSHGGACFLRRRAQCRTGVLRESELISQT